MCTNQTSLLIEDEDKVFLRRIIFPEEDRHLFTTIPWRGGYRWFRSPNIVPIEQWRAKVKAPSQSKAF
jgi:hypothetical protein